MKHNKVLRVLVRASVALSFVLTFFGWYMYFQTKQVSHSALYLVYITIQTFLLGISMPDPAPVVLTIMCFLAPLSLASTIVYEIGLRLQMSFLAGWLRLRYRGYRRITLAGRGLHVHLLYSKLPKQLHAMVIKHGEGELDNISKELSRTTFLEFPRINARILRQVGAAGGHRLFLFPSCNEEAWELLEAASSITRTLRKPVPVTLLVDNVTDAPLLKLYAPGLPGTEKGKETGMNRLLKTLDLQLVDSRQLMVQKLLTVSAPHHHPKAQTLFKQAPSVVIHGQTELTAALTKECIEQFHYPALCKVQLTVITESGRPDSEHLEQGYPALNMVADLAYLAETAWLSEGQALDRAHVVYILGTSLEQIDWRLQAWVRRCWLANVNKDVSEFWYPLLVPVLCGKVDVHAEEAWDIRFQAYGIPEIRHLVCMNELLEWKYLVEGQELIDTLAQTIHGAYQEIPGCTDWPTWKRLSSDEREMNRRPARHLSIKLWSLGYNMKLGDSREETTKKTAIAKEITELLYKSAELQNMLMHMEHRRWLAEKILDGFQLLPQDLMPVDDAILKFCKKQLKLHPNIVDFNLLSQGAKDKDKISFQINHLLAHNPGLVLSKLQK